jgi:NNP family nitrate/nitrite transporter-like MFS transporter
MAQLKMLKDPEVWRYCQYYSVVFGGYVGLSLWMVKYYVTEYGFDIKSAALLAACFSLPGGVLRAFGGWLSDKYGAYKVTWWVMWVCWVAFFLLSYPQTDFTIKTINGMQTFHIGLTPVLFTMILFVVGIAMAVGKASVFKFISDDYSSNIGAVSGVVGLAGGLGGIYFANHVWRDR